MDLPFLEFSVLAKNLGSIAIAFLLALPVGWEREQSERSAGLRTVPLVAMASCGHLLIEGLITGIGFIGGGAILKSEGAVRGTATAASIWNTGAIGAAVAFDRYEVAILLAVVNFAALRWLALFKEDRKPPPAAQS